MKNVAKQMSLDTLFILHFSLFILHSPKVGERGIQFEA